MITNSKSFYIRCLSVLIVTGIIYSDGNSQIPEEPVGLHLTWQYDPTTTMTIDWHTKPGDEAKPVMYFRHDDDDRWQSAGSYSLDFPHSDRTIHRTKLTGLKPGATYNFRVGEFSRVYKFRTMPENLEEESITFATGGDTRHSQERMERTSRVAMEYDPDFIVWGGDLSYADARDDRVDRWYEWFEANMNTLISEDGRVVPILTAIGNHEMKRDRGGNYWYDYNDYQPTDEWRLANAGYFFNLFAFPGLPGYGVIDFGDYLSFLLLDSNHANPVKGVQEDWLRRTLRERTRLNVTHVFPVYHVPAYPSHRSYDGRTITNVRETFVPLFEKNNVRVAFENHDHTYKRTHPIRNGEIADDGIVYIGDGAWGTRTREGSSSDEWYINEFASVRHAIIVTLDGDTQEYEMVDEDGNIIDSYIDNPR